MNIWALRPKSNTHRLATWDESVDLEGIVCPVYPGHQRGGRRITDLSVYLPAKIPEDFVWTWQGECIIQDEVLSVLLEESITGFTTKPVRARFRSSTTLSMPALSELVVTGWGGMAREDSGIKLDEKQSCLFCGSLKYTSLRHVSRLFDETQWDGSDIFMIWPLPKYIFVTNKVANLIQNRKWTGASLIPLADFEISHGGFGPGRLSNYMPIERAKELGEGLGIV